MKTSRQTAMPTRRVVALAAIAGLLLTQGATAVTQQPAPAPAPKTGQKSDQKSDQKPAVGTPAPASGGSAARGAAAKGGSAAVLELDWEELVPQDARSKFAGGGPPPPVHDYLGEGGMAAAQPMDFSVNQELDGAGVRIPGFIVPLDIGKDGLVSEFFLVPYFGACIHVPPPPPNQIVYVKVDKGIALDSIYEAYWVTGKLKVARKSTQLGAAAYSLAATKVEIYKY